MGQGSTFERRLRDTSVDNAGMRDPVLGPKGVKAHDFDVRDNSLKMQEWYLKEAADVR